MGVLNLQDEQISELSLQLQLEHGWQFFQKILKIPVTNILLLEKILPHK